MFVFRINNHPSKNEVVGGTSTTPRRSGEQSFFHPQLTSHKRSFTPVFTSGLCCTVSRFEWNSKASHKRQNQLQIRVPETPEGIRGLVLIKEKTQGQTWSGRTFLDKAQFISQRVKDWDSLSISSQNGHQGGEREGGIEPVCAGDECFLA